MEKTEIDIINSLFQLVDKQSKTEKSLLEMIQRNNDDLDKENWAKLQALAFIYSIGQGPAFEEYAKVTKDKMNRDFYGIILSAVFKIKTRSDLFRPFSFYYMHPVNPGQMAIDRV